MNSNPCPLKFGQAIAMLALFLAFQTAIVIPAMIVLSALRGGMTTDTTVLAVANGLAMVPTVWLGSLICRRPWRQLIAFGPMPWRLVPVALLMGLGGFVLCSEVENMTRMVLPMPRVMVEIFKRMFDVTGAPVGAAIALIVVAPCTEEPICRGWVLGSLLPKWRPWKAIVVSGLIFGLMHMNPWQFFYASVLGFVLGWLYWRTGSVWLCAFVHALNNGLSWFFSYFNPEIQGLTTGGYGDRPQFQAWWLDVAAAVVLVLGIWLLHKQTPAPPPIVPEPELPPIIP